MAWRRKTAVFMIDNYIWVLLLFLIVVATFLVPRFFSTQNFLAVLYQSTSFSMMVLGMTFCLLIGQFDLSIESVFAFGPAIGTLFMLTWFPHSSPYLAIVVTILAGAAVGLFNGLMTVKLGVNAFLQTLCMLIILRGFVLFLIPMGIYRIPSPYLFLGEYIIPGTRFPLAIIICLLLFLLAHLVITKTPFGKNLIASGSNQRAAFLAGIDTGKLRIWAFVLSGGLAALGGLLLVGRMGAVENSMGNGDIMQVFAAAVLGGISLNGGKGSISGALGGLLVLSMISNVLNLGGCSPFLIQAIQGVLLLLAVVIENFRERLYHLVTRQDLRRNASDYEQRASA